MATWWNQIVLPVGRAQDELMPAWEERGATGSVIPG